MTDLVILKSVPGTPVEPEHGNMGLSINHVNTFWSIPIPSHRGQLFILKIFIVWIVDNGQPPPFMCPRGLWMAPLKNVSHLQILVSNFVIFQVHSSYNTHNDLRRNAFRWNVPDPSGHLGTGFGISSVTKFDTYHVLVLLVSRESISKWPDRSFLHSSTSVTGQRKLA